MNAILYSLDTYHCKYDTMSKFNAIFDSYYMNKALDKYYTYYNNSTSGIYVRESMSANKATDLFWTVKIFIRKSPT